MAEMDEDIEPLELYPCGICGRTFLPAPLRKHEKICEKTSKKRKPFNSLAQRVSGTDLAVFHMKSYLKPNGKQQQSPYTCAGSRTGLSPGGAIERTSREKSPVKARHHREVEHSSSVTHNEEVKASPSTTHLEPVVQKRSTSSIRTPATPVGERCPHCDRTFGHRAFERHVEWCKEHQSRVQTSPASVKMAKERLEARTKYRAPAIKSQRSIVREKYSSHKFEQSRRSPSQNRRDSSADEEEAALMSVGRGLSRTGSLRQNSIRRDDEKTVPIRRSASMRRETRKVSEVLKTGEGDNIRQSPNVKRTPSVRRTSKPTGYLSRQSSQDEGISRRVSRKEESAESSLTPMKTTHIESVCPNMSSPVISSRSLRSPSLESPRHNNPNKNSKKNNGHQIKLNVVSMNNQFESKMKSSLITWKDTIKDNDSNDDSIGIDTNSIQDIPLSDSSIKNSFKKLAMPRASKIKSVEHKNQQEVKEKCNENSNKPDKQKNNLSRREKHSASEYNVGSNRKQSKIKVESKAVIEKNIKNKNVNSHNHIIQPSKNNNVNSLKNNLKTEPRKIKNKREPKNLNSNKTSVDLCLDNEGSDYDTDHVTNSHRKCKGKLTKAENLHSKAKEEILINSSDDEVNSCDDDNVNSNRNNLRNNCDERLDIPMRSSDKKLSDCKSSAREKRHLDENNQSKSNVQHKSKILHDIQKHGKTNNKFHNNENIQKQKLRLDDENRVEEDSIAIVYLNKKHFKNAKEVHRNRFVVQNDEEQTNNYINDEKNINILQNDSENNTDSEDELLWHNVEKPKFKSEKTFTDLKRNKTTPDSLNKSHIVEVEEELSANKLNKCNSEINELSNSVSNKTFTIEKDYQNVDSNDEENKSFTDLVTNENVESDLQVGYIRSKMFENTDIPYYNKKDETDKLKFNRNVKYLDAGYSKNKDRNESFDKMNIPTVSTFPDLSKHNSNSKIKDLSEHNYFQSENCDSNSSKPYGKQNEIKEPTQTQLKSAQLEDEYAIKSNNTENCLKKPCVDDESQISKTTNTFFQFGKGNIFDRNISAKNTIKEIYKKDNLQRVFKTRNNLFLDKSRENEETRDNISEKKIRNPFFMPKHSLDNFNIENKNSDPLKLNTSVKDVLFFSQTKSENISMPNLNKHKKNKPLSTKTSIHNSLKLENKLDTNILNRMTSTPYKDLLLSKRNSNETISCNTEMIIPNKKMKLGDSSMTTDIMESCDMSQMNISEQNLVFNMSQSKNKEVNVTDNKVVNITDTIQTNKNQIDEEKDSLNESSSLHITPRKSAADVHLNDTYRLQCLTDSEYDTSSKLDFSSESEGINKNKWKCTRNQEISIDGGDVDDFEEFLPDDARKNDKDTDQRKQSSSKRNENKKIDHSCTKNTNSPTDFHERNIVNIFYRPYWLQKTPRDSDYSSSDHCNCCLDSPEFDYGKTNTEMNNQEETKHNGNLSTIHTSRTSKITENVSKHDECIVQMLDTKNETALNVTYNISDKYCSKTEKKVDSSEMRIDANDSSDEHKTVTNEENISCDTTKCKKIAYSISINNKKATQNRDYYDKPSETSECNFTLNPSNTISHKIQELNTSGNEYQSMNSSRSNKSFKVLVKHAVGDNCIEQDTENTMLKSFEINKRITKRKQIKDQIDLKGNENILEDNNESIIPKFQCSKISNDVKKYGDTKIQNKNNTDLDCEKSFNDNKLNQINTPSIKKKSVYCKQNTNECSRRKMNVITTANSEVKTEHPEQYSKNVNKKTENCSPIVDNIKKRDISAALKSSSDTNLIMSNKNETEAFSIQNSPPNTTNNFTENFQLNQVPKKHGNTSSMTSRESTFIIESRKDSNRQFVSVKTKKSKKTKSARKNRIDSQMCTKLKKNIVKLSPLNNTVHLNPKQPRKPLSASVKFDRNVVKLPSLLSPSRIPVLKPDGILQSDEKIPQKQKLAPIVNSELIQPSIIARQKSPESLKGSSSMTYLKKSVSSLLDPVSKPRSLRNKGDVEKYFGDKVDKKKPEEKKTMPEELFSVDDEMYEEYKKYEQMYLQEKMLAEANKKSSRDSIKAKRNAVVYGDESSPEDLSSPERQHNESRMDSFGKPSGDSAYSSLNRSSPKPYSRTHHQHRVRNDRLHAERDRCPSSSGSDISLPPVSSAFHKSNAIHKSMINSITPRHFDFEPVAHDDGGMDKFRSIESSETLHEDEKSAVGGSRKSSLDSNASGRLSKFCYECGSAFPVSTAKFCVNCGVARLVL